MQFEAFSLAIFKPQTDITVPSNRVFVPPVFLNAGSLKTTVVEVAFVTEHFYFYSENIQTERNALQPHIYCSIGDQQTNDFLVTRKPCENLAVDVELFTGHSL